jgi:hypothetical protein
VRWNFHLPAPPLISKANVRLGRFGRSAFLSPKRDHLAGLRSGAIGRPSFHQLAALSIVAFGGDQDIGYVRRAKLARDAAPE